MIEPVCRPGKCVRCGVDFDSSNRTEVMMLLSDKSKLRLGVCMGCKDKIWDEDKKAIVASICAGWKEQLDRLGWPEAKKDAYMRRYAGLEIVQ